MVEEQQRKAVGEDLNLDVSLPAHPSSNVCACETGWWGAVGRQIQQAGAQVDESAHLPHYPLSLRLTARLLQEGDVGGQASGPRKLRRKVSKRDEERAAKRSRGPQAHQMVAAARPTDLSKVSAGVGCAAQIP
jgi:hypothetical protein